MKKILIGASVLLVMMSSACKKDDKKPANNWTLDGTTYTPVYMGTTFGQITASDAAGNSCAFTFNSTTTAPESGTYKVVAGPTPGDHELIIVCTKAGTPSSTGYVSTGAGDVSATVTVDGEDITVSVTDAEVKNINTGTETVKFSANQLTTK